jgi:hypothetical protein
MTERYEVDDLARELALTKFGLPLSLHVPIAARDATAIERFVGQIERVLLGSPEKGALLVRAYERSAYDPQLAIWQQPGAAVLRQESQVWVHVDERQYRKAYVTAFPADDITQLVLDHVMNRRVARLKSFSYLRIVPITRSANSSSGGLCEKWAVTYHSAPGMVVINKSRRPHIQYADLADIVKMLNVKTGGSLQDAVNDAQAWLEPAT